MCNTDGQRVPLDSLVCCFKTLQYVTQASLLCVNLHRTIVVPAPGLDTTTTTVLRPFFRDHPGEPVPEENFWTLWCKGRLIGADTPTIRLGATPSGLTSAHLHHPPYFLQAGCPSCCPTNSFKALAGHIQDFTGFSFCVYLAASQR